MTEPSDEDLLTRLRPLFKEQGMNWIKAADRLKYGWVPEIWIVAPETLRKRARKLGIDGPRSGFQKLDEGTARTLVRNVCDADIAHGLAPPAVAHAIKQTEGVQLPRFASHPLCHGHEAGFPLDLLLPLTF